MRRVASIAVLAIVAWSIACGGFLGFGDDDPAPPSPSMPGDDAGADVATAEGGSIADGSADVCLKRTIVLGTDAGIAGPDWSPGINTTRGGASLVVEDGKLVSRTGNGIDETLAEATVFATRLGNVSRIRCDVRASSSSFGGTGRLVEFRIDGPSWVDVYSVRIDWGSSILRIAHQARPVGGEMIEGYPRLPALAPSVMHDIVFEMTLGDAPKVDVSIDGVAAETVNPPATGTVTRAQVAIGTLAFPPFEPHEVQYESVVCEMCAPP